MHRTQILLEPQQYAELTAIAAGERRSLSDLVREMLRLQLEGRRKRDLTAAAEALLADYRDDPELSAFTALDADDVHAQG
jgi:Arc/MetJ-type ribon-helix-helix transcriptional regulator